MPARPGWYQEGGSAATWMFSAGAPIAARAASASAFDVVEIDLARRHAPMLRAGAPAAHPAGGERLPARRIVAVKRPELEQCRIGEAAIGVAPRRGDEPRQQRRAHRVEIGADRIDQPQFRLGAAEQLGLARRDEREGHRFDQPALGEGAADQFGPALHRRRGRPRQRRRARAAPRGIWS